MKKDKDSFRKTAALARKSAFENPHNNLLALKNLNGVLAQMRDKKLAGYSAMRTEISPVQAMQAHFEAFEASERLGSIGMPVIIAPKAPLKFRAWAPDCEMIKGTYGAMVPKAGPWMTPDVVIVPLLAFDRLGYRLGYGGGFYDRTLEELRKNTKITAIGFAFSAQELSQVPIEETDQKLDLIVTECGTIYF